MGSDLFDGGGKRFVKARPQAIEPAVKGDALIRLHTARWLAGGPHVQRSVFVNEPANRFCVVQVERDQLQVRLLRGVRGRRLPLIVRDDRA
jgi:hypothetical protein